jgi:hypothetical protein
VKSESARSFIVESAMSSRAGRQARGGRGGRGASHGWGGRAVEEAAAPAPEQRPEQQ